MCDLYCLGSKYFLHENKTYAQWWDLWLCVEKYGGYKVRNRERERAKI